MTFPLPGSVWWDNYYNPLILLPDLKTAAAGDPDAEAMVAFSEREIEMHRVPSGDSSGETSMRVKGALPHTGDEKDHDRDYPL